MKEALHDVLLSCEFPGLTLDRRLPDETTIRCFRHLLEQHKLADQSLATRPAAPQRPVAEDGHRGGSHAVRRAQFDDEQQRRAPPEDTKYLRAFDKQYPLNILFKIINCKTSANRRT